MSNASNLFAWLQSPMGIPWAGVVAIGVLAIGFAAIWNTLWPAKSAEIQPLADENAALRSKLQLREWELDLTRRFLGARELSARLQLLLEALVVDSQLGFAGVFRVDKNQVTLERSLGLLPETRRKLTLNIQLVRNTLSQGSVAVSGMDIVSNRGVEGLSTVERSRLSTLYCFRLGSFRNPWGLLISSDLPEIQPDLTSSLSGWEHLTSILGEELASQESNDRQGNELALTREMLELRSLADQQFRSPSHLLQEFLRRLAEMSDFERATLILSEDEQHRCDVPMVRGGGPLTRELLVGWEHAEDQLLTQAAGTSSSAIWSEAELMRLSVACPFSMAVTLPLRHHDWTMGHLCLTRRSTSAISDSHRRLISWGAKYLVELVVRTVDRAAIELQARRDGLTHLANRQTFDREIDRSIDQSIRLGHPLSLILLDLDRFKSVNDTHGHLGGDAALKTVAHIVERSVQAMRDGDQTLVARYGGEEMAVLLPGVGDAGARRIAESIREAVRRTPIPFEVGDFHVTLSAGVSTRSPDMTTSRALISSADEALYRAKANGRNRVEVAPSTEDFPPVVAAGT